MEYGRRSIFARVKKVGGYAYLYLIEDAWEGDRHVQRFVAALGALDALTASAARNPPRSIVLSRYY